jgi:hypothetical protein
MTNAELTKKVEQLESETETLGVLIMRVNIHLMNLAKRVTELEGK